MAFKLLDRARMSVTGAPGTGQITLGAAAAGYQTFQQAGINNGDSFPYALVDGANWEYGVATYSSSGNKLTRAVTKTSAQNASPLSLSSKTIISSVLREEDVGQATTLVGLTDVNIVSPGVGQNGYAVTWNSSNSDFELLQITYAGLPDKPTIPTNSSFFLRSLGDVNITPGPFVDGYAITWNNSTNRFVMSPFTLGTFAGLNDVSFSGLATGQVPTYNSGTGKWSNGTLTISGAFTATLTITGTTTITLPTSGTLMTTSNTLLAAQVPTFTGDMTTAGGTLTTAVNKIGGKTVTLGGALTISGSFGTTFTVTGTTSVTLPTSGTLATVASSAQVANNLSDLASATTARTNLGLGTMATQNANAVAITGGTLSGVTTSGVRTAVNDASYTALTTDREIAYTAITAARTITLCAASAFPVGTDLKIIDESGSVSLTNTLTVNRAGSDTISGITSMTLMTGYGYMILRSNGSNTWTVVGRSVNIQYFSGNGTYTPTPGMTVCDVYGFGGGGGGGGGALQVAGSAVSGGAGGGGGGQGISPARFTAAQIGASKAVTIGAGGSAGIAATTNNTAGGNGGVGGNTTLGGLYKAPGGGGGGGGQLANTSGGGGGGGHANPGVSSTGITGGALGFLGGGPGGTGVAGTAPTILTSGGGGTGGPAAGTVPPANGTAPQGGSGGGAGGGITTGNVASAGSAGGNISPAGNAIAGASGGAVNTIGGAGVASGLLLSMGNGTGGGGGGAGVSGAAGAGGVGALGGGGGGGGGSMTNGGTAGTAGIGGAGQMWIVEFF